MPTYNTLEQQARSAGIVTVELGRQKSQLFRQGTIRAVDGKICFVQSMVRLNAALRQSLAPTTCAILAGIAIGLSGYNQIASGQSRVLLVWTRLITPDGHSIVIEELQGADGGGYSGSRMRSTVLERALGRCRAIDAAWRRSGARVGSRGLQSAPVKAQYLCVVRRWAAAGARPACRSFVCMIGKSST